MKKCTQLLFGWILFGVTLFMVSCKHNEQIDTISKKIQSPEPVSSQAPSEEETRYHACINKLDQMLSENIACDPSSSVYLETIGSIYIFPEEYNGGMQALFHEEKVTAFQMLISDAKDEKQSYFCRLLKDGSFYFTYETTGSSSYDLPAYTVNEAVLRYARADFAYDDGNTDLEAEKQRKAQKVSQCLEESLSGTCREFWYTQEKIYEIDRDQKAFFDVTDHKEAVLTSFLLQQLERIQCQILLDESAFDEVQKRKPSGYSLLWGKNSWHNIAVCDLNHDEKKDYVAVLYPDDYEEVKRYETESPYEHYPQYYAAGLWLFLSTEADDYEQIQLSDSVEYWETELSLINTAFVGDGILSLEYFIGRSPFSNAVLEFQYDEERKNFYILRSYYRDSYDDSLLIGDANNYGDLSITAYFQGALHYCEGTWESDRKVLMSDGSMLDYYSSNFQYQCENPVEEHHINSLIWEKEYELIQALKNDYPESLLEIDIKSDSIFYNHKLSSGSIRIYGTTEHQKNFDALVPVVIDKQRGEYLKITELIDQSTFLEIFDRWAEDALAADEITRADKISCKKAIEQNWETAEKAEGYLGPKDRLLFLSLVEEGVKLGIQPASEDRIRYYLLDKEYFYETDLWSYLAPCYALDCVQ